MTAAQAAVPRWRRELRALRRAAAWHRRLLAAGLAAGAAAAALTALRPAPPATAAVLVAARDLPGGATVGADDVVRREVRAADAPSGAVRAPATVLGRVLAGPVRRGEAVTDARLVGPTLVAGYGPGMVAAPVRIADSGAAGLLRAGDLVDVLAAGQTGRARLAAAGVRVVAVPRPGDDDGLSGGLGGAVTDEGALVVLATTPEVAAGLAGDAVTARLSVVLRAG